MHTTHKYGTTLAAPTSPSSTRALHLHMGVVSPTNATSSPPSTVRPLDLHSATWALKVFGTPSQGCRMYFAISDPVQHLTFDIHNTIELFSQYFVRLERKKKRRNANTFETNAESTENRQLMFISSYRAS